MRVINKFKKKSNLNNLSKYFSVSVMVFPFKNLCSWRCINACIKKTFFFINLFLVGLTSGCTSVTTRRGKTSVRWTCIQSRLALLHYEGFFLVVPGATSKRTLGANPGWTPIKIRWIAKVVLGMGFELGTLHLQGLWLTHKTNMHPQGWYA